MLNQLPLPLALGATPEALVLRLRTNDGEEAASQIVRVTASRCTIGSGEVCNLQVPGPGPDRLNCLIVRGRRYPVVRRWSQDTLLNGQPFTDAVLSPGDRLTTGGAEFEVLEGDAATEPDAATIEVATEPGGDMRALALQHWEENDRLRAACEQNRARARRLLAIARAFERRLLSRDESESRPREPASDDVRDDDASASPAEAAEVRFEATSADAPVSASSLLMRLGAALPDQEEDTAPASAPRAASHEPADLSADAEEPSAAAERANVHDSEDHDESIDTYMARLMDRVAQKKAQRDVLVYGQDAAEVGTSEPTAGDEPAEPSKPEPLTELPLRSVAPAERLANMSAMRELAKLNAHSLLDRHLRSTFFRSTVGQALVLVAALVAGLWLTRLSSHGVPAAIYPAMIAFAFAIVWGFNYLAGVRYVLSAERSAEGASLAGKLDEAIAAKTLGNQPRRNKSATVPLDRPPADLAQTAPPPDDATLSR